MTSQPAVTLTEVARRAGVSVATASRVLNGSERSVGADLRHRVLAAAAELDYVPNLHAQAVARGSSSLVGLVVHDIADPYFSTIAAGVMAAADERGLIVSLGSTLASAERELDHVALLRAQRARALILAGSRTSNAAQTRRLAREVQAFRTGGGRVACISQPLLGTDTVAPENEEGARALAVALAGLGHRRFAVLAGPEALLTATDRLAGFRAGVEECGGTVRRVLTGPFTRDGGYRAVVDLLAAPLDVTCVFAVNDVMAVGAMAALRERGVSVPGDLSVAGFDDIPTLRDVAPPLTTVRLPLGQLGRSAAELALALAPSPAPQVVAVPGEVVLRESTRRLVG
ncbi:LacI family DNA-binding transcriptional regulator [Cryptosporangium aurantiacum]|uniref:Transcriptional regulator, LacI family n=1 Tax=Cryptosporangium aurantiacum TaxID=134849 RepID=A0A1M7RNV1_9ACTN|nr:LacI family DNA-binding transcriptional regulator [Cryptosporangium aurantiacum]SHN47772.1 transcriptional regulator, LacI family [Cryptosporangium aurantiacum]